MTGTFDDWGKTVRLDKVGDIFLKEVTLPKKERIYYKACIPFLLFLSFWHLSLLVTSKFSCCLA